MSAHRKTVNIVAWVPYAHIIMEGSSLAVAQFSSDPKKMWRIMLSKNSQKFHPLHITCQENLYYLTRVILNAIGEYNVSINIPNVRDHSQQPLNYAYNNNNVEMLKLLLSHKVQPYVN